MDNQVSRTSSESSDYYENADEFCGDDEGTLDEEESFAKCSDDIDNLKELALLAEENEMSVEELRKKYLGVAPESSTSSHSSPIQNNNCTSHSHTDSETNATSSLAYFTEDALNDENDDDEYLPPPDPFKKFVRVGSDYQVNYLPELNLNSLNESNSHSELIWIPAYDICSADKLEIYLSDCEKLRHETLQKYKPAEEGFFKLFSSTYRKNASRQKTCDDEDALYQLYKSNYSIEKAKEIVPKVWKTMKHINGPRLTHTEPWRRFNEEDCNNFELGLRTYGKNFFMIKTNLMNHRTVGELVRFYYSWKKTERHDSFIEKNKLTPALRKESLGTTDIMDNIINSITNGNDEDEFDLNSEHNRNANFVISSIKTTFKSNNVIQSKLTDVIENI